MALTACRGEFAADGAVGGRSLDAKDAVLHSVRDSSSGAVVTEVLLGDFDDICARMSNNPGVTLNGFTTLFLDLGIFAPGGVIEAAGSPGRFDVLPAEVKVGSRVAAAEFLAFGKTCGIDVRSGATSGTVTVTHAAPALASYHDELEDLAAEFDLSFADGHLAGRFHARRCPGWYAVAVGCP